MPKDGDTPDGAHYWPKKILLFEIIMYSEDPSTSRYWYLRDKLMECYDSCCNTQTHNKDDQTAEPIEVIKWAVSQLYDEDMDQHHALWLLEDAIRLYREHFVI